MVNIITQNEVSFIWQKMLMLIFKNNTLIPNITQFHTKYQDILRDIVGTLNCVLELNG